MKILLTLFILLFSSSLFADDISDFQIEGISIGDSLLDYFSEEEIENYTVSYYTDKTFTPLEVNKPSFENYDYVRFDYRTTDRNYIIQSIAGIIIYKKNIDACYKKMDQVATELSNIFKGLEKIGPETIVHPVDKTGKSIATYYKFFFKSEDMAEVLCYDYSEESGFWDHLSISLKTEEFNNFLLYDAYN